MNQSIRVIIVVHLVALVGRNYSIYAVNVFWRQEHNGANDLFVFTIAVKTCSGISFVLKMDS